MKNLQLDLLLMSTDKNLATDFGELHGL